MHSDETLDLAQAAAMLFAEPETVSKLARCGELPGTQVGKGWVFMRDDVLAFLRIRIARDTEQRRRKSEAVGTALAIAAPARPSRRRKPPELPQLPGMRVNQH